MKKTINLIIALCLGTTMVMAGNKESIQDAIGKQLKISAGILKENYEKVAVDFKMKPNGEIALVNVNTNNAELKKEVTEHFSEIDFSNAEKLSEGNYSINILFKVL